MIISYWEKLGLRKPTEELKFLAVNAIDSLSFGAIGLLWTIIEIPEEVSRDSIYALSPTNTKEEINEYWDELIEKRYILGIKQNYTAKDNVLYICNCHPFTDNEVSEVLKGIV